jgi:hypothetical protein
LPWFFQLCRVFLALHSARLPLPSVALDKVTITDLFFEFLHFIMTKIIFHIYITSITYISHTSHISHVDQMHHNTYHIYNHKCITSPNS